MPGRVEAHTQFLMWLQIMIWLGLFIVGCCSSRDSETKPVVKERKWRSLTANGKCECIHPWGRQAVVDVKSVTVKVDEYYIRVDAEIEQPTLDGEKRAGYFWPQIDDEVAELDRLNDTIELVDEHSTYVDVTDNEIRTIKTARIVIEQGEVKSVVVAQKDEALFDVKEVIEQLRQAGGVFAERSIEDLVTFDGNNRSLSFTAVFCEE